MPENMVSNVKQELIRQTMVAGMPESAIDQLVSVAEIVDYPSGTIVFQESEFHDRIHLLCDGMVRLEMRIPNHETQTIMTLGKGDLLAWSPFLSDGIMTTTAIALQPTRAIDFNASRLRELCHSHHELGYFVMRHVASSLARRLLATRLQLLDLFSK